MTIWGVTPVKNYFQEKSVLVTGGSSGIGLATARLLRQNGANLILIARNKHRLDVAKKSLQANTVARADVQTLALDVCDQDSMVAAIEPLLAKRPVDILINNAGMVMPGHFLELPGSRFEEMMATNFSGAVNLTRLVLPGMIERKSGHIGFVSSFAGLIGIFGYTAYSASKFAIRGFCEALRCETKPHNVRVSVCYPPDTDTPQLAYEDKYKPAETRAIAANVKPLTADAVAAKLLRGMAAGKFHIVPGAMTELAEMLYRLFPGMIRGVFDRSVCKAMQQKERTH